MDILGSFIKHHRWYISNDKTMHEMHGNNPWGNLAKEKLWQVYQNMLTQKGQILFPW